MPDGDKTLSLEGIPGETVKSRKGKSVQTTSEGGEIEDIDRLKQFQLLPADLLPFLTPEESELYNQNLSNYEALLSPLSLAMAVSNAKEYEAVKFVDKHIVALVEGRLYRSGIGPPAIYLEDAEDADGNVGRWGHPTEPGHPEPLYFMALSEPPRHGKSFLTSFHTSAWLMLRFPTRNVAVASYESRFAASWGKLVKGLIKREGPRFGVQLDPFNASNEIFGLTFPHTAEMYCVGVGGPFTGRGAHHITIDDPIKNAAAAMSPTQRLSTINWYQSVAYTRREPAFVRDQNGIVRKRPGTIIVMNTRWHEEDLMGWVIKTEPEKWYALNLPALALEDDPLGRQPGEALIPERYGVGDLNSTKATVGAYWFSAMYQGDPSVAGGGILPGPYLMYRHETGGGELGHYIYTTPAGIEKIVPVEKCRRFGIMDLAYTVKTSSDYTVLAVWDVTPDKELILHRLWRMRLEGPDHEEQTKTWIKSLDKSLTYLGVEKAALGANLIQTFNRTGFVPVHGLQASSDKITRAIPAGIAIAAGRVYFPKYANFTSEFIHELEQFPNGAHDDQVDVLSYAVLELDKMSVIKEKTEETSDVTKHIDAFFKKKAKERRAPKTMLGRW